MEEASSLPGSEGKEEEGKSESEESSKESEGEEAMALSDESRSMASSDALMESFEASLSSEGKTLQTFFTVKLFFLLKVKL